MSISGFSYSVSFRKRQRALDDLSEQFSRSEFQDNHAGQNASQSHNSNGHSQRFTLKQSLLKRSLPGRVRLFMRAPGDNHHDSHAGPDSTCRHETNSRDARPLPPRHRADPKAQTKPNEIARLNGANEKDHRPPPVKKPGIVVIHQRAFFRDCFVRCLEISYRSHGIFAFTNILEWRNSTEQNALTPAVIVFFVDGSGSSSVADLQFLESSAADIPVVIMSDIDDTNYVMHALRNGARGYIPTSLPFNVAVEAVRLVEAGGTFVPVSSLELDRNKQPAASKTNELLTERQMMVVEALCQGMANKQIAYELGMSEHTVKVHLRHIMRKLKVRNRTEVAVLTKDFFEKTSEHRWLDAGTSGHKDVQSS